MKRPKGRRADRVRRYVAKDGSVREYRYPAKAKPPSPVTTRKPQRATPQATRRVKDQTPEALIERAAIDQLVWRVAAEPGSNPQQFLYVMQAEDGRIKIGRSIHPLKRRQRLQSQVGLRVWLCLAIKGRGSEEGRIHALCAEHRVLGEWFINTDAAMDAIRAAIGEDFEFKIPKRGFRVLEDGAPMTRDELSVVRLHFETLARDEEARLAFKAAADRLRTQPSHRRPRRWGADGGDPVGTPVLQDVR